MEIIEFSILFLDRDKEIYIFFCHILINFLCSFLLGVSRTRDGFQMIWKEIYLLIFFGIFIKIYFIHDRIKKKNGEKKTQNSRFSQEKVFFKKLEKNSYFLFLTLI
jgi:hypothetical protein